MMIIMNFMIFSNFENLENKNNITRFKIDNEIISNLFDEKSELDKIDTKLLEFFYTYENKKCDYNLDENNNRIISLFIDGKYYSGHVRGVYTNIPYGKWSIDSQTYECYGDNMYILNGKEKRIFENLEGMYKLFIPENEKYFFLTVKMSLLGKNYERSYIIEKDKIGKIKESSYLYFDDKIILNILVEGKYQKLDF